MKHHSMNIRLVTLFVIILPGMMLLSSSCKKYPDPDYPQLAGVYHGTTSQSETIEMQVENIEGILYVTVLRLNYRYGSGGTGSVNLSNTAGLSVINNTSFSIVVDPDPPQSTISGIFNPENMTVSGSFKIYPSLQPEFPASGDFIASRIE
jgi:hypothetical protein